MSIFIFILIALTLLLGTGYLIFLLIKTGKEWHFLIFFILYLPMYITLQSFVFQQTKSPIGVFIIQYLKEFVLFIALGVFVFYQSDLIRKKFKFNNIDLVFGAFILLAFIFLVLPIGEVAFLAKAAYFKNILLMGLVYFLGRNMTLSNHQTQLILKLILGIALGAFCINLAEFASGIHFHTLVNYGNFQNAINDVEPTGNYGLSWTFETQSGVKRFGAFFANPLDLASASLLAFPIAFIFFIKTPHRTNQILYGGLMMTIIGSLLFAYSRASITAFILELIFIAFMFKYYRLLWAGVFLIFSSVIYIMYFASEDLYFFVLDTLTFENASSLGHLIEFPEGIGLAMSGNGNGVDNENSVGGENQFLIFGVQMGILGLFLYISLLYLAIKTSIQAYRKALTPNDQIISFVAGTTKFALLLPLFTANAELYLFVSLISWWMVGQSVKIKNSTAILPNATPHD
jgi:hypothetical protein